MMIDKLKAMSRDELVNLAATQGVQVHHKSKPETIIKAIVDKINNPPVVAQEATKSVKKEPVFSTPEQVEEAIADIKQNNPNFRAIYDEESRSVTFQCNGAEDSVTLSLDLKRNDHWPCIYKKAKLVARGRLAPRGLNNHFESLNSASGKNAYTNTVLC